MTRKAEFFNVRRDVLVPEETMNRIAAVIDIVKEHDTPEGRAAKFIRHEIDLGLQYYPGWREVDAENAPTEGEHNEPKEIDWEQRRYEIAKDVMSGWAASTEGLPARDLTITVDYAIEIANELIRQLKAQEK